MSIDWLETVKTLLTVPTKNVIADVECRHGEPNPDSAFDIPCGWSGSEVIALWSDTREALWVCPNGHENSEPYTDYA